MPGTSFEEMYSEAIEIFDPQELSSIEDVRGQLGNSPEYHKYRIEEILLGHDAKPASSVPKEGSNGLTRSISHEYWSSYFSLAERKSRGWGITGDTSYLQTLDENTSRIVSHLFDPSEPGRHAKYGLVIGHVQSGKTGNYTGVIAKAADKGYNLVVILTGLYNDLRLQTQIRIEKELTGTLKDKRGMCVDYRKYRRPWRILTRAEVKGEFFNGYPKKTTHYHKPLEIDDLEQPTIMMMKKNVTPLVNLNNWIAETDTEVLERLNVLVIDDESDHASVNTMTGKKDEEDHSGERSESRINGEIRKLILKLPRFSYVGYTATPFANVFVNDMDDGLGIGPTLYPRDFIVSLPSPDGYYGLSSVFSEASEDEGRSPVRIVPYHEAHELWEISDDREAPISKRIPESLLDALRDYFLTAAARRCRGEGSAHHSMLIHTKLTKKSMAPLAERVELWVKHWKANYPQTRTKEGKLTLENFRKRWEVEFSCRGIPETWDQIDKELHAIFHGDEYLDVKEINDESEDVLDYSKNEEGGLRAIVIGGNRLSRGLTLEGLIVSYFIREVKQTKHDTLLQMARWFGYRGQNEDLVRVYTTSRLNTLFSRMIQVEESLRIDLELYEEQDEITPRDFGVRVMKALDLLPTSPNKSKDVRTISTGMNFDGGNCYTRLLPLDRPDNLRANLKAFAEFANRLGDSTRVGSGYEHHLWKTDSKEAISFLESLKYPEQKSFDVPRIVDYINRRIMKDPRELSEWSIVLAGLQKSKGDDDEPMPLSPYGNDVQVWMPERSRKSGENSIGDFTEIRLRVIDLPDNHKLDNMTKMWKARKPWQPLILCYIFDKNSKADTSRGRKGSASNTDLFLEGEEKEHVLGVSVYLPRTNISMEDRENERQYWIRPHSTPFPGLE